MASLGGWFPFWNQFGYILRWASRQFSVGKECKTARMCSRLFLIVFFQGLLHRSPFPRRILPRSMRSSMRSHDFWKNKINLFWALHPTTPRKMNTLNPKRIIFTSLVGIPHLIVGQGLFLFNWTSDICFNLSKCHCLSHLNAFPGIVISAILTGQKKRQMTCNPP